MAEKPGDLEIASVIGFKGTCRNGLILHPDNEHLVFAMGCTVVVRNVIKRTQFFLVGHDNEVNSVVISPDGKLIASGQVTWMGFVADIIVWDFETRMEKMRLSLHQVEVKCLVFSPSCSYLASMGGQDDNSLVVWDLESGSAICGARAGNDSGQAVVFLDDLQLVSAGNYHVTVWNIDLGIKKLRPTQCAMGALKRIVTNLVVDPSSGMAYCGTQSGDLLEIDTEHYRFKRTALNKQNFSQGITATCMLKSGHIIAGTGEGYLVKFNPNTLTVGAKSPEPLLGSINSITLSSDHTHAFVGTSQSNIYWVNLATFDAELRNTCHYSSVNDVVFPRNYSKVFATASTKDVRVWNAQTRQEVLRIQVPNLECYAMCFMPDGSLIITAWSDGKIRAFKPQSGRLEYCIENAHKNGCTAVNVTSDNARIVSGGMEGEVRIWKLGNMHSSMEGSLKEHRGRVWSIQITQDDTRAFTSSSDGSCILWNLENGTRSIALFESTVFKTLSYHPDESQILTSGSDRKITWWDTFDGQAIRVLEGSASAEVNSMAMSRSGSHFVSVGGDKLVKLWSYDEGLVLNLGVGHSGAINAAAIAPDQSFIVSVSTEGSIFMWKVPDEVKAQMTDVTVTHDP